MLWEKAEAARARITAANFMVTVGMFGLWWVTWRSSTEYEVVTLMGRSVWVCQVTAQVSKLRMDEKKKSLKKRTLRLSPIYQKSCMKPLLLVWSGSISLHVIQ
jgi:uncharacterized membrane protein YfbV (UPF0208 family)